MIRPYGMLSVAGQSAPAAQAAGSGAPAAPVDSVTLTPYQMIKQTRREIYDYKDQFGGWKTAVKKPFRGMQSSVAAWRDVHRLNRMLEAGDDLLVMASLYATGLKTFSTSMWGMTRFKWSLPKLREIIADDKRFPNTTAAQRAEVLSILEAGIGQRDYEQMPDRPTHHSLYDLRELADRTPLPTRKIKLGSREIEITQSMPPADRKKDFVGLSHDLVRAHQAIAECPWKTSRFDYEYHQEVACHAASVMRFALHNDPAQEADYLRMLKLVGEPDTALAVMREMSAVPAAERGILENCLDDSFREEWRRQPFGRQSIDAGKVAAATLFSWSLRKPWDEPRKFVEESMNQRWSLSFKFRPQGGVASVPDPLPEWETITAGLRDQGESLETSTKRVLDFYKTLSASYPEKEILELAKMIGDRHDELSAAAGGNGRFEHLFGVVSRAVRPYSEKDRPAAAAMLDAGLASRRPTETLDDSCERVRTDQWALGSFDGRAKLRERLEEGRKHGEFGNDSLETLMEEAVACVVLQRRTQVQPQKAIDDVYWTMAAKYRHEKTGDVHQEAEAVRIDGIRVPRRGFPEIDCREPYRT